MNGSSGEMLVGLRLITPVGSRVRDGVQIADRDVDPEPVILSAGFNQQHARVRVRRQPVSEYAAGAPCADDDVVPGRHALLCADSRPGYHRARDRARWPGPWMDRRANP